MAETPPLTTPRVLKTVIFFGSSRDQPAFWGGDTRLGDRVLAWVQAVLAARSSTVGAEAVTHDVLAAYDPLEVFGEGGGCAASSAAIKQPHFFMKAGDAPPSMDAMRDTIKAADCFLIVSPEYNHSIPPALSGMMGNFGGSNYAYKPSAIVTYSPSPWGGMRAAVALRPFLSELGCLPVSKLCGMPTVAELLEADGTPKDAENRMLKQLPAMLGQLEWMAIAMANMRESAGLPQ